jgi:5-methylcytosine-specific restriction endonuclease McrA
LKDSRWETYDDYLKSPEWAHIRQMVIDRAKGRCQVCNSDVKLQVHHRVYDSPWGQESTDDLVCLCQSCHMTFHKNESKIRKVNKLEKKLDNMKKAEANRSRKKKMKSNPPLR